MREKKKRVGEILNEIDIKKRDKIFTAKKEKGKRELKS